MKPSFYKCSKPQNYKKGKDLKVNTTEGKFDKIRN